MGVSSAPGAGSNNLYVGNNHNPHQHQHHHQQQQQHHHHHHQNLAPDMGLNCMPRQHSTRASTSSVSSSASYASMPVTATSAGLQQPDRRGYPDAMDASHGLLSMSQETPRNIYGPGRGQRGSADSYGFPSTHSTNSSISSASNYGSYRESSISDYSTMGSDLDLSRTRALPRPQNMMTSQVPPAPSHS
ncbi:unnamed protein product [Parascedosporium putredinis]|uniref:Uncharacterized protein n=1 Tax=Parascedosporium putredinis TaxID=1442378 RepID=A0A9P1MBN9_9PEZI|nr:unnamed protein product [Parascedosporium putredinis]CAI7999032.1 unnamed protein product [Parascedosporium putredinis]